jgi:hypothetical protein
MGSMLLFRWTEGMQDILQFFLYAMDQIGRTLLLTVSFPWLTLHQFPFGPCYCIALLIKHLLDSEDCLDIPFHINPLASSILSGMKSRKLGLPIPEHISLKTGEMADLTNLIEDLT